MTRLDLGQRPHVWASEAILAAWRRFGCAPLGGPSTDGWSRLGEFQRCPYRYYLRYVLGATLADGVAVESSSLAIGSFVHAALAIRYARLLPKDYPGWRLNLPEPMAFLDACLDAGADQSFVYEAKRLFGAYEVHYEQDTLQPVAVEFSAGIPGIHTCRYDAIAWRNESLWIVEHKSTSRDDDDPWWLDGEIVGEVYAWQLSELREVFKADPAGVIINMIIKSKPPRFRQLEVVMPAKVIRTFAADRAWWTAFRESCQKLNVWPKALNGCRGAYNDFCFYHAHCRDENANLLKLPEEKAECVTSR